MNVKLKKKEDAIGERLKQMTDRSNSIQSFLKRVTLKQYKDAQRDRWMTEGKSEDKPWDQLNSKYAEYKRRKFADYPGAGQKMMIRTNALYEGTVDRPNVIATNKALKISVNTENAPYADYANEARPFMKFSQSTIDEMKHKILEYLKGI